MNDFLEILHKRKRQKAQKETAQKVGFSAGIAWHYVWKACKWLALYLLIAIGAIFWLIFSIVFGALLKAK